MTKYPINIAFIGIVSAGKSTLLNAILSDTYTAMKLQRTTMTPQVYSESTDVTQGPEDIRQANSKINQDILAKREKGETVELSEAYYDVVPLTNFYRVHSGLYYRFFDIPGLNDQGSQMYFDYIKEQIDGNKFDLVFLVFDIYSGINRTDELNVLKTVLEQVSDSPVHVIIVANKADDMYFKDERPKFDNVELNELFAQMKTAVDRTISSIEDDLDDSSLSHPKLKDRVTLIPMAAEILYIYRNYQKNPELELDDKYIDKLAINEIGKVKWIRECREFADRTQKLNFIKSILSKANLSESINNTGFGLIDTTLRKILNLKYQEELLVHKWRDEISDRDLETYGDWTEFAFEVRSLMDSLQTNQNDVSVTTLEYLETFLKNMMFDDAADICLDDITQIHEFKNTIVKLALSEKINNAVIKFHDTCCSMYLNHLLSSDKTHMTDVDAVVGLEQYFKDAKSQAIKYWSDISNIRVQYLEAMENQIEFLKKFKRHFATEYQKIFISYYYCLINSIDVKAHWRQHLDYLLWQSPRVMGKWRSKFGAFFNLPPPASSSTDADHEELNSFSVVDCLLEPFLQDCSESETPKVDTKMVEQLQEKMTSIQEKLSATQMQLTVNCLLSEKVQEKLARIEQELGQAKTSIEKSSQDSQQNRTKSEQIAERLDKILHRVNVLKFDQDKEGRSYQEQYQQTLTRQAKVNDETKEQLVQCLQKVSQLTPKLEAVVASRDSTVKELGELQKESEKRQQQLDAFKLLCQNQQEQIELLIKLREKLHSEPVPEVEVEGSVEKTLVQENQSSTTTESGESTCPNEEKDSSTSPSVEDSSNSSDAQTTDAVVTQANCENPNDTNTDSVKPEETSDSTQEKEISTNQNTDQGFGQCQPESQSSGDDAEILNNIEPPVAVDAEPDLISVESDIADKKPTSVQKLGMLQQLLSGFSGTQS